MGSRCTGGCCRSFRLSVPLSDVRDRVVAAMVVPLGHFPEGAIVPDGSVSRGGDYFDCRHLNAAGNCDIYAQRPAMCRAYPASGVCEKAGCTWTP